MEQSLPVYILSGFLGSGKTTLLQRLLDHWNKQGLRPAVIMNELGEVNLDGLLVEQSVPMAEMLGGCICCTSRGDLSTELTTLVRKEQPDVVVIEATGAANPLEIVDAVTESSLYQQVELKGLITVVDAAHLLGLYRSQQGATYRLMQEQIRCASVLILNKLDRVEAAEAEEISQVLRKWNAYAEILPAVRCELEPEVLLGSIGAVYTEDRSTSSSHEQSVLDESEGQMHASHDHVMAYTHYFKNPVNSEAFERFVKELPRDVYRAKGIVTFNDTTGRFLFQYAYREADFMKITPQGDVPDVAVFIGEHFSSGALRTELLRLEKRLPARPSAVKRTL